MRKMGVVLGRLVVLGALLTACRAPNNVQAQSAQSSAPVREQLGPVAALDTTTAFRLSNTFRAAADRALPAVVYIQVVSEPAQRRGGQPQQIPEEYRRFFEQFGLSPDDGQPMQQVPQQGAGSGFILDAAGHIMTNHHVVSNASRITVRTLDGHEYEAKLIGSDANTDVAVIKIEPRAGEKLPVSSLGNSDEVRVGDWVLALGNPLGFNFSVTAGIVSAKGRQLQRGGESLEAYIQTDAAINPGNSGGPLVDLFGRVVAMNTAIEGPSFIGYGFAVPINLARRVADDLLRMGYVRRPRLGVRVQDITAVDAEVYGLAEVRGAEIVSVEAGSPAADAGLRAGDVVLALNGRAIPNATELTTSLAQLQPGQDIRLTIWRERREQQVSARLGEFARTATASAGSPAEADVTDHLGFRARELTPQLARSMQLDVSSGVVITDVNPGGPAYGQGIGSGQVLISINGQAIRNMADFTRAARAVRPGSAVALRVLDPQLGETVVNYRSR